MEIPSLQFSDASQLFSLVTEYPEVSGNVRVCLAGTLGTTGCVKVALASKDIAVFSWSLHRKAQEGHEEKQPFPSIKHSDMMSVSLQ